MHWLARWFIFRWALPFVGIVGFFQALAAYYGLETQLLAYMAEHRAASTLVLATSLVGSLLHEILSVDRPRLDQLARDKLLDDDHSDE